MTYDQCFFMNKYLMRAIQVTCFGILKTLCQFKHCPFVLNHPLMIGFPHKLISLHDFGYRLHFNVAQQFRAPMSYLLPMKCRDAELNRQFLFGNINKIR